MRVDGAGFCVAVLAGAVVAMDSAIVVDFGVGATVLVLDGFVAVDLTASAVSVGTTWLVTVD